MCVDNTTLFVKGNNIDRITTSLQDNFNILLHWFSTNHLSLNAKKTESVLFCHKSLALSNETLCI